MTGPQAHEPGVTGGRKGSKMGAKRAWSSEMRSGVMDGLEKVPAARAAPWD